MHQFDEEKRAFEGLVRNSFHFLEEAEMNFRGVRRSGEGDPRDNALIARYSGANFWFDIGWNPYELSLAVLIKFDSPAWAKQESYVCLEPFLEYLSRKHLPAIVPYITEQMSMRTTKAVVEQRRLVFANGVEPPMRLLAEKIRQNLNRIRAATHEEVQGYHKWMESKR